MSNRTEYHREYQRRRRVSDPVGAKAASAVAYERRKAAEAADPSLRERRLALVKAWQAANPRPCVPRSELSPVQLKRARRIAKEAQDRYRKRNAGKIRARWRAHRAMRDGRLVKQPCSVCGSIKVEMHHPDYGQPLQVDWVCKDHHPR